MELQVGIWLVERVAWLNFHFLSTQSAREPQRAPGSARERRGAAFDIQGTPLDILFSIIKCAKQLPL
jgi:hypothetical protein